MFYLLNTLEKRMTLLFLGFKNYRLRLHREGLEAVRTLFRQRGELGAKASAEKFPVGANGKNKTEK